MKQYVLLFALVLFVGAGCVNGDTNSPDAENNSPGTKSAMMDEADGSMNNDAEAMMQSDTGISLQAESRGNGRVYFEWKVDESVDQAERYRIVRSANENPEFNGRNYWLQVDPSRESYTWVGLPQGEMHFRLCTFDAAANACETYSNNVMVEVE